MSLGTLPAPITIIASLDDDPHFKGSIHDDASARVFGYRSALVPGPVVYGYLSQIPIEVWGLAWLERGAMSSHSHKSIVPISYALHEVSCPCRTHCPCNTIR